MNPVYQELSGESTSLLPKFGQFSTNSATLYFACNVSLYTIDVSSGNPVLIGSPAGLTDYYLTALTTINGTLYGGELAPAVVVSVNPTSSAVSNAHSIIGTGFPALGLAPIVNAPAPTINTGGVVPIYSSSTTIQPGSWVSIYGTNFAGSTNLWTGNFPTSLGGVTVTIDNKLAYLWLVAPNQINLQAPDDSATGTVSVAVTNTVGTVSSTVTLDQYGPSFSMFSAKYPAALVQTPGAVGNSGSGYDLIGPAGVFSFATRPVIAGETLVLYGVGFGPTTPSVSAGEVVSGAAESVTFPVVTVGGMPATVTFAGIVEAGLFQLNVVVPNAGHGDQSLQASIGGLTTPPGVFISLQ
jgi:uncharacterized protein (TIGR03437 family)